MAIYSSGVFFTDESDNFRENFETKQLCPRRKTSKQILWDGWIIPGTRYLHLQKLIENKEQKADELNICIYFDCMHLM